MHDHDDFDFEDSPGIPAPLPSGENILWQGSPNFREVAINAFHLRKISLYFGLILLIQAVSNVKSGSGSLGSSLSLTLLLSAIGVGILLMLAYLTSRVTIYTLTNKRILIRFGIALQMTINLPFSQIHSADMRVGKNGFGDIPLRMTKHTRVSYIALWPNIRPWNFSRPEPMLRCIANVEEVAQLIAFTAADVSDEASDNPVIIKQKKRTPTTATTNRHFPKTQDEAFSMKPEVS